MICFANVAQGHTDHGTRAVATDHTWFLWPQSALSDLLNDRLPSVLRCALNGSLQSLHVCEWPRHMLLRAEEVGGYVGLRLGLGVGGRYRHWATPWGRAVGCLHPALRPVPPPSLCIFLSQYVLPSTEIVQARPPQTMADPAWIWLSSQPRVYFQHCQVAIF